MAGPERVLAVLPLFSDARPDWTAEEAGQALGVSTSSAYRYFAVLAEAGLLTAAGGGRYRLGPAFIQYDRQIQRTDPVLRAARPVMAELADAAPPGSIVLLCQLFRDSVLCVHQAARLPAGQAAPGVSYERGRPMPLFRGATSKVILAQLPPRRLRQLHASHQAEIQAAGLGADWPGFRAGLTALRRAAWVVTRAELDKGRLGVAVPLFDAERRWLGSLSYVLADRIGDEMIAALGRRLAIAAGKLGVVAAPPADPAPDERLPRRSRPI
jgi:DNA-binding IclR family transcriptional regulator